MKNRRRKTELEKSNFRFNTMTAIIYIIAMIILIRLFYLQIMKGDEYRENSNTRLSREADIQAARGSILDKSGTTLVSSSMSFSLELYKTKIEDNELNQGLLLMTQILAQNGDSYVDNFPISINPYTYNFSSEEELAKWKKKYKIPNEASAEEAFYLFRDKYDIEAENPEDVRRILAIRYEISTTGYSTTKSLKIADPISRESSIQLSERSAELPGINIIVEPERKYYMGSLASHIIGYMGRITKEELDSTSYKYANDDYVGKTGIEKMFEEYLRGEDGKKQIDMTVEGTQTGEYTTQEAIGGADIVLTIDANLQRKTEEALRNNIEKIRAGGFGKYYDAQGGACVVMEVKTGKVLAMASYPDYEPEQFWNGISQSKWNEYNNKNALFNRSIQGTYAPGSTFKMVTAIGALQENCIAIGDKIDDNGPYQKYADYQPKCWVYNDYGYGHRRVNVISALEKSCNYYFYEVGSRLGVERLADYARFFGLGQKTGIELSGEATGTIATRESSQWTEGSILSASIGQSLNDFSPIQMAKYISTLANGGHPVEVTIIENLISSTGTVISRSEIEDFVNGKLGIDTSNKVDKTISEENIAAVLKGMKNVAEEEGGTAYKVFKDFNIEVGGKTGSAEAYPWVNAWFAGFAPFNDPQIAVVVLVENGGHGYYTAEVVKEVISEYFGMNRQAIRENMSADYETESIR